MATTDVDICNSALFNLGANEISSLEDDESDRAALLARVYPAFKEARLTEYPWNWARTKAQCSQDATAPANEWKYQYLVPAECLEVHAVYDSSSVGVRPFKRFERQGGFLLSDATVLYIDMTEDKDESDWPGLFEDYAAAALSARIAHGVTGRQGDSEHWWQVAYGLPAEQGEGGLYRKVKAWDSRQTPPKQIQDWTLVEARFGGAGLVADERLR
ncbi:MAG: hypothetical protein Unbinned4026contig1001_7 [Prokaryotic dsDNA virus sp.]|nr:MAG: hypothetical protein Unbinned4026contig1001_7 [Prokaryotic dsDNA virus sp.]|tara:strand:- start:16603 stop:17247 length:645 start_codon:yes stop_codon:yes gene_type:complete